MNGDKRDLGLTISLRERAEKGLFWSFIDAIGERMVQFSIGVILARLLLPEDFGLIGMLLIFMGVAQVMLLSGFGSALIQKKEVSIHDTSSVFYFNIFMGFLLAGLLFISSPWIASFYNQEILTSLTRCMSLVIVISSFGVVQTAMLIRNMDFKTQTIISFIGGLCSGIIGVTMAYQGFGVWSLVAQQVSASFLRSCLLWLFNTWRPALVFKIKSLNQMFAFGSKLMIASLLNAVFNNIYHVVIGRVFTLAAVGYYTRAKSLEEIPAGTLSTIVARVGFPLFSIVQEDKIKLRNGFRKSLGVLIFINSPVMVGLAVVAEPLVLVLFTEKWLPSVRFLQLLTLVGILYPFHTLNLNVLMAKGRSDLFLCIEIITKILVLINIAITWRIGISAMILGQFGISTIGLFITSYYTGKIIHYNALSQLRDMSGYFGSAIVMGACVYLIRYLPFFNDLYLLIVQVFVGLIIYVTLCRMLRLEAMDETWDLIKAKFQVVKRK